MLVVKNIHIIIINLRFTNVKWCDTIKFEKMKRGKKMVLAYIFAVLKCVIYGSSVFFTGALCESVDVLDILSLRFLLSLLVLWVLKITKILKINVGIKDVFKKGEHSHHVKNLLLAALFEPILYMFFETLGISMVSGVTAGIILSLQPVSSVICESVMLKENTTLLQKIFLGMGIVGVVYISVCTGSSDGGESILGMLIILAAVLSSSLFQVFSRKSSHDYSPFEVTYFATMLGAIAFNFINVVRHIIDGNILNYFDPFFSVENMIGFLFLGVVSTIGAASMSNYALGKMQISTMSAFGGISTITTILVGVFINSEPFYYFHYIGIALIVARMIGVSVIAIRKDKMKLQDDEIRPREFAHHSRHFHLHHR